MKRHKIELTDKELEALLDSLDTYSALSEGIDDDGTARRDLMIVDKMLNKNGIKRKYK